jgi:hypothetical protein
VGDGVDLVGFEVGFLAGLPNPVEDALALVGGRRDFRGDEAAVGREQDYVGEGSANVRADPYLPRHGGWPPLWRSSSSIWFMAVGFRPGG